MKNKTIITTDGKEQGWIDTFNEYNHTNYKLNQEIEPSQIEQLNDKVIAFNNMVAYGPAIHLEVVQAKLLKMKCAHCGKALKIGDEYIEYENDRYCADCYSTETTMIFKVGGEYLTNWKDGITVYDEDDLEV